MASIILYFDSQYLQIYFSSNQQLNRNLFSFLFFQKKPDRLPARLFLQITTILNIIKRGESFYHVSMVQNPARFPNGMHCPHGITDIHSTHFHLR